MLPIPGRVPALIHSSIPKFPLAALSQFLLQDTECFCPSCSSGILSTKALLGLPGFSHGLITNTQLFPAAQELPCPYFASPPI